MVNLFSDSSHMDKSCLVRISLLTSLSFQLLSCASLPLSAKYLAPPPRPSSLDQYYSKGRSYTEFKITSSSEKGDVKITQYKVNSDFGESTIDYYQSKNKNDSIVFVFPVLGGKNVFENYFAEYFAGHGVDGAIVHRANEFKKPEHFDHLEELFKNNLIRDRVAIDFFEKEFGKKKFGSFGISRGGINVAMTAGVDPRLKYNVIVMGGTDLVGLFKNSSQKRIKKYVQFVSQQRNLSKEEFFEHLRTSVVTDPKNLAHYINAKDTLLILSSFDSTVPFEYGMKLRAQIGKPRTIFLAADHYTSLLYTQFVPILLPNRSLCLFPFDYIEGEALSFYEKGFNGRNKWWRNLPLKILQLPVNFVTDLFVD